MSTETINWLNNNIIVGQTDKRGTAWWSRLGEARDGWQNHFPGAVPVEAAKQLLGFEVVPRQLSITVPATIDTMTGIDEAGDYVQTIVVPDRNAWVHSLTNDVLGIFSDGYLGHQYVPWLLNSVSTILGDTLQISSVGVLKKGAIAWVEVSVPDNITTPEGVVFRPNLLATTSFDGSISTTYKRTVTDTVCDNTRAAALGEKGQQVKVKHTRNSEIKLTEAREALAMVHDTADVFQTQVRDLCATTVTDKQWADFLNEIAPIPAEKGRSRTMAGNKQDGLRKLWTNDLRVAPWKNTAFGVVQAVNTFVHHEGIVRGAERAERNMLSAVTGGWDKLDSETFNSLDKVLLASA